MEDQPELDTATIRAQLQRHGLSETAAETYLAVVEHGSATASDIADTAGISTSYVYDVCDDLAADGFVVVEDHQTPTEVRAVPPSEAFGRLRSELETLESAVTARYEQRSTEDVSFEVVKSRQTIEKRLESYIDAADAELLVQIPAKRLRSVADSLKRARDRGVLVLLSLSGGTDLSGANTPGLTSFDGSMEGLANVVRVGPAGETSLLAADQERGFVSPATMLGWDHDDTRGVTFHQREVADVLVGSYLGNYWPIGEETLVARPPSLPATYGTFRHVVFAVTLQLRAGNDVGVDLYASPIGTDQSFGTVSGTVVDVRQNLVEPISSDFGFENSLVVDTGDERITVGGLGAFLEDYECKQATLRPM